MRRSLASIAAQATLALFLVAVPRAATAQNIPANVLIGKWCGEQGDYIFTHRALTVLRRDGTTAEMRIARITTGRDWIQVYWLGLPKVGDVESNTLFNEFSADRRTMNQAPSYIGDKGPLRIFRRC